MLASTLPSGSKLDEIPSIAAENRSNWGAEFGGVGKMSYFCSGIKRQSLLAQKLDQFPCKRRCPTPHVMMPDAAREKLKHKTL